MAQLFPVFDTPSIAPIPGSQTPRYQRSLQFDFATGDFLVDGTGRLIETDGRGAWRQWCLKSVLTERLTALIYGPNYGAEMERAKKQPNRQTVQSAVEREITESLLIDPRTESVRDFAFSWSGDSLRVNFTVYPTVGAPETLEVLI